MLAEHRVVAKIPCLTPHSLNVQGIVFFLYPLKHRIIYFYHQLLNSSLLKNKKSRSSTQSFF